MNDPYIHGLGAIQLTEVDSHLTKKRRDRERKRVTQATLDRIRLNYEQAYKIAEYIYANGETKKYILSRHIGAQVRGGMLNVLTYETYLFGNEIWVSYETDDGRSLGLINKYCKTPIGGMDG